MSISAQRQEAERLTRIEDIRWWLSDPRGRRLFRWMVYEMAGVNRATYSPDPAAMAHAEGERNVGLGVLAEASEHAPRAVLEAEAEALERELRKRDEESMG